MSSRPEVRCSVRHPPQDNARADKDKSISPPVMHRRGFTSVGCSPSESADIEVSNSDQAHNYRPEGGIGPGRDFYAFPGYRDRHQDQGRVAQHHPAKTSQAPAEMLLRRIGFRTRARGRLTPWGRYRHDFLLCGTTSTGHGDRRVSSSATEPKTIRFNPAYPCVPHTMMSAAISSA